MGRSFNTLKGTDVTTTPIKLKYSNVIPSASLSDNGITMTLASNMDFDYYNPAPTADFLLYRSVRGMYYMNYISGSLLGSGSGYEWYPQSTAASGTLDTDDRSFPTASDAQVLVISIPRNKFGEGVSKGTFNMTADDLSYVIVDDANGNLIDTENNNAHVGNIIYNQGNAIVTNSYYLSLLVPPTPCSVPTLLPFNVDSGSVHANWVIPSDPTLRYEYVVSTSNTTPTGSGTVVLASNGTEYITGLTSGTTYYFFIRSRCTTTSYSSWISQSFTTQMGLVPFRTGLILELESFTGSVTSGGNVTQWKDMSGNNNNVFRDAQQYQPVYVPTYFNGQPGIFLSASALTTGSVLRTNGNLNGLSGSTGMTAFIVTRVSSSLGGLMLMEYAKSGSITDSYLNSTGSMAYAITTVTPSYTIGGYYNGNVGISNVTDSNTYLQSQPCVLSITADSTIATREVVVYRNNSTGSLAYSSVNNSGSFDAYPLAIGSGVNNGKWLSFQGYIGSVLIYNKVLSDSEKAQVYTYLSSSYL